MAFDLRGLVDPALSVGLDGGADTRGWRIVDGSLNAPAGLADGDRGRLDSTLAALVALTAAAWSGTTRFTAADDGAQRVLTRLGLH